MKSEEEYFEILADLMQANQSVDPDWLDDNLRTVLFSLIHKFNTDGIEELVKSGNVENMLMLPFATPVVMFSLGVLYGRREAAELLAP